MDSQLAQLLLSDKIDQVVQVDQPDEQPGNGQDAEQPQGTQVYVKGYTHLSFHEPIPAQQEQNDESQSNLVIQADQDPDSDTTQSINQFARGSNVYKQSNKQFFGNIRQLREIKEEPQDTTIDEKTQLLELDPRDRFNPKLEEKMASKRQCFDIWPHVFMVVLLVLIVLVFLKASFLANMESFSYIFALGVPFAALTIILAFGIILPRYLLKLRESHSTVFYTLLGLLILVTILAVAFGFLLALYFDNPRENKMYLKLAAAPYFLILVLLAAFYIYISPGLFHISSGLSKDQVVLIGLYLVFFILYGVLYLVLVAQSSDVGAKQDESTGKESQTYSPDLALAVFVPILVILSLHLLIILPAFMCKQERKLEFLAVSLLVAIFVLELKRFSNPSGKGALEQDESGFYTLTAILILTVALWVSLYLIFFLKSS